MMFCLLLKKKFAFVKIFKLFRAELHVAKIRQALKLNPMLSKHATTGFYDSTKQMVKIFMLVISQQHKSQFYNDVSSTTKQNVCIY